MIAPRVASLPQRILIREVGTASFPLERTSERSTCVRGGSAVSNIVYDMRIWVAARRGSVSLGWMKVNSSSISSPRCHQELVRNNLIRTRKFRCHNILECTTFKKWRWRWGDYYLQPRRRSWNPLTPECHNSSIITIRPSFMAKAIDQAHGDLP